MAGPVFLGLCSGSVHQHSCPHPSSSRLLLQRHHLARPSSVPVSRRATHRLIRQLDLVGQEEAIGDEAVEKYERMYQRPLPRKTMAAERCHPYSHRRIYPSRRVGHMPQLGVGNPNPPPPLPASPQWPRVGGSAASRFLWRWSASGGRRIETNELFFGPWGGPVGV